MEILAQVRGGSNEFDPADHEAARLFAGFGKLIGIAIPDTQEGLFSI